MNARTVCIGESIINTAIRDKKIFDALSFVLKLKVTYVNSCLYQWSINKVASLSHCSKQKAKEVVNTAFEMGWIKERTTSKGKEIYAIKLCNKKENGFVFQIADSAAGKQIYIGRHNKRQKHIKADNYYNGVSNSDIAHFLVMLQNNMLDDRCHKREKNKKKPQTFSDVRDIIIGIIVLDFIKQWQNSLDSLSSSRMGVYDAAVKEFATNYLNYGLPIEKFKKRLDGLNLSTYQVTRIIHNLKRYGLVTYKRAKRPYLKLKEGEDLDVARFNRLNENTGKVDNVFMRCWRNKKGDPDTYYIYEAYIYKTNAMTKRKPHKPHKANSL